MSKRTSWGVDVKETETLSKRIFKLEDKLDRLERNVAPFWEDNYYGWVRLIERKLESLIRDFEIYCEANKPIFSYEESEHQFYCRYCGKEL